MARQELARTELPVGQLLPVIVSGCSRDFGQEPAWRRGEGIRRGVLTVRQSLQCVMNAILVTKIPVAALSVLDHRERGYRRCHVSAKRLVSFGADPLPTGEETIYCYVGRSELSNSALQPNDEYLAGCLEAAALWGKRFHRMFLQTTFVAGKPLGT